PADALPILRQGHELLARLCELEPDAAILEAELAPSHRLLGHVYNQTGRKAEALAEYEEALAVMRRVVRQQPEVTDFQNQLARCHFDRGMMLWELGSLARAQGSFTSARDIRRALVKAIPGNLTTRTSLGITLLNLSGTQV